MEQTWENWEKNPSFWARLTQIWVPQVFSWALPPLCGRQCCKISLYEISKKTNDLNVYFFVCLFLFQKSGFASH